ncbi:endoribonuclease dcr-1 [Ditylenchus destructor]|nr:endoribonuclease dcr-1 [Ditylenchus destructor]
MDFCMGQRTFKHIRHTSYSLKPCSLKPLRLNPRIRFQLGSPIRFTKLERVLETGKVRVTVDVNDMRFVGMGRSYRIAKSTAAKRALKHLRGLEKSANGEKDKNPKK